MPRIAASDTNNLYRIKFTSIAAFLIVMTIFSGFFAVYGATENNSLDSTPSSRSDTTYIHADQLKTFIGDDASWSADPKTTALAALALVKSDTNPEDVWQNENGNDVSLANSNEVNTIAWLQDYLDKPEWYTTGAEIDVEIFSLILLTFDVFNAEDDTSSAVAALKAEQDPVTGGWNDDVYETALAVYAIISIEGIIDTAMTDGADYLLTEESSFYWDTERDTALAILALNAYGYDITDEYETLASKQDAYGSFGSVEATMWAVIAFATDSTGSSINVGENAQTWLRETWDGTDQLDLAMAALGESINLYAIMAIEDGNGTYDNNGAYVPDETSDNKSDIAPAYDDLSEDTDDDSFPLRLEPEDDGSGAEKAVPTGDENTEGSGTTPDSFFRNNWFMALVAVIIVIIIISLATWGLIARVEEGRALEGVRRDIVEYIRHNPGEHFAGIMHEFDMSPSSTTYHLKVLEDTEMVVAHRDNKYKRYFIAGNTISRDIQNSNYKELMAALKNATARKIVWYLLDHQGANQKNVSEALGLHPSTINWHANRLNTIGILEKIKSGKEISYTILSEDSVRTVLALIEDRT